jgi:F-type H+-transporting ATPase subunit b
MNNSKQSNKLLKRFCGSTAAALLGILLLSTTAAAAEPGWRPIYDKVMLWINFFIFVFLAVKFGKKPLLHFLQGQKDEVADHIHRLQKQKNALEAQINKTHTMIEDSSVRFEQIKSRIMEDGERSKQKIIEDAKAQGKNMIEVEKLKATNQITQAKDQFMAELVDEASALAQKRLPSEINDSDHNNLLGLFLSNISNAPKSNA